MFMKCWPSQRIILDWAAPDRRVAAEDLMGTLHPRTAGRDLSSCRGGPSGGAFSNPADHAGQHLQNAVDLRVGGRRAQGQPKGRVGQLGAPADGQEDVRWVLGARVTGRTT